MCPPLWSTTTADTSLFTDVVIDDAITLPLKYCWREKFNGIIMLPPLIGGGIKRWCASNVWRLSVAYIGPKSRTERHRKTKIGTEVAHFTCDSDTTFKVKRSKVKVTRPLYSLPCWRVRQLQRWASERVGREKLLLRCRLLGRARRFGARGRGDGRGIL